MSQLETAAVAVAEQTVAVTKILVVSAATGAAVTIGVLGAQAAVSSVLSRLQTRKANKKSAPVVVAP